MVKVGMVVQYPLRDENDPSDRECPLLITRVHPQADGTVLVDGFVFDEEDSRYVKDIQPGNPSQANTYHEID
jgi:hypothetical protein